jgi:hypothetical protein
MMGFGTSARRAFFGKIAIFLKKIVSILILTHNESILPKIGGMSLR